MHVHTHAYKFTLGLNPNFVIAYGNYQTIKEEE